MRSRPGLLTSVLGPECIPVARPEAKPGVLSYFRCTDARRFGDPSQREVICVTDASHVLDVQTNQRKLGWKKTGGRKSGRPERSELDKAIGVKFAGRGGFQPSA